MTSRPSDMKALFEYAGAFDFVGKEEKALPLYKKVLQAGYENLPKEDQPRLFVQLESRRDGSIKEYSRALGWYAERIDSHP